MKTLSIRPELRLLLNCLFWIPTVFFSLLLVWNTIPYFTFDEHMPFLEERIQLMEKAAWRVSFYVHIAAGSFCILSALLQFSSWILRSYKKIHIISGRIYVFVVLLLGAPSGFYMTFFAKGGYAERGAFMAMALFWFWTTWKGFTAVVKDKNIMAHRNWMLRSYAMALTAVSFRILHLIFHYAGLNTFDNYSISLWISILGNAAVAEWIIYRTNKTYLKTILT